VVVVDVLVEGKHRGGTGVERERERERETYLYSGSLREAGPGRCTHKQSVCNRQTQRERKRQRERERGRERESGMKREMKVYLVQHTPDLAPACGHVLLSLWLIVLVTLLPLLGGHLAGALVLL
jgi:hypothetical protein